MNVVISLFLLAAMVIALGAALFTNVKLWRLVRESHASIRSLPRGRRRSVLFRMALVYSLALAEAILLIAAPFGVRRTLIYFAIVPVVVIAVVGVIGAGVAGARGQRHRRPPTGPSPG